MIKIEQNWLQDICVLHCRLQLTLFFSSTGLFIFTPFNAWAESIPTLPLPDTPESDLPERSLPITESQLPEQSEVPSSEAISSELAPSSEEVVSNSSLPKQSPSIDNDLTSVGVSSWSVSSSDRLSLDDSELRSHSVPSTTQAKPVVSPTTASAQSAPPANPGVEDLSSKGETEQLVNPAVPLPVSGANTEGTSPADTSKTESTPEASSSIDDINTIPVESTTGGTETLPKKSQPPDTEASSEDSQPPGTEAPSEDSQPPDTEASSEDSQSPDTTTPSKKAQPANTEIPSTGVQPTDSVSSPEESSSLSTTETLPEDSQPPDTEASSEDSQPPDTTTPSRKAQPANTEIPSTDAQPTDSVSSPEESSSLSTSAEFIILPVGLNVGTRNAIPTSPVRGFEDGSQAIDFNNWLVPFEDVLQALDFRKKNLEDGQLELRSPGSIVRIDPTKLPTDPDLGQAISVADISGLLQVPTEFDIAEYAIVFNPPWLAQDLPRQRRQGQVRPISLEGLPVIKSSPFGLSAIGQRFEMNSVGGESDSQGELIAVGNLFGGSLFGRILQTDFTDFNSWSLEEAQFLQQTSAADYVAGSQTTFWDSQSSGQLFGVTTIQRWGFTPPTTVTTLGSGFSPSTRLQTNQVTRTIAGRAEPGTLAQLVSGLGNRIVDEVLVDSSGIYRFENIPTSSISLSGFVGTTNFRVFLYPNGQLTAIPEIRQATFENLPGQLPKGASALIASAGVERQFSDGNLVGTFGDLLAGASYRFGVTDSLTLGAGLVYDQSPLGLTELFLQPANIPLRISVAALIGTEADEDGGGGIDYIAAITYRPFRNVSLNINADEFSERFNLRWQAFPGLSFNLNGDTEDNAIGGGIGVSSRLGDGFFNVNANIDTQGNPRWIARLRQGDFEFSQLGNEVATSSQLLYDFSGNRTFGSTGNSAFLRFDTNENDTLTSLGWQFSSAQTNSLGERLWSFELGYGVGSQGNGPIAAATTNIIPGIALQLRYEGVNITSDEPSFQFLLFPSFLFRPRLSLGENQFERLRSEGGLLVEPFFDANSNGKRDRGEKLYTEDPESLLLLNNQSFRRFSRFRANRRRQRGISLRLIPGTYRLDIDPAGYPPGWKTNENAFAIQISPGGFTRVPIPLVPSFTVAGTVRDVAGNPVGGARVEAVPLEAGRRGVSVTNGAGIFFLEDLEQGVYNLLIDGTPAQPNQIEITPDSQPLQELDLSLP